MGVAGWRGGTTDLCPGRQKPSRGHWAYLPQLSYNTRPDPTRSDPSTGPTLSDPTEPDAKWEILVSTYPDWARPLTAWKSSCQAPKLFLKIKKRQNKTDKRFSRETIKNAQRSIVWDIRQSPCSRIVKVINMEGRETARLPYLEDVVGNWRRLGWFCHPTRMDCHRIIPLEASVA